MGLNATRRMMKKIMSRIVCIAMASVLMIPAVSAEGSEVPYIQYTEPEVYEYEGTRWDSGVGVSVVLPDRPIEKWEEVTPNDAYGRVGGIANVSQDLSIIVYSGEVTYDPSVSGIYQYVLEQGYTDVCFVNCNGEDGVQFLDPSGSELSVAFPYEDKVTQVSIRVPNKIVREKYADWVFSSLYLGENSVEETTVVAGKVTKESAYLSVYQYVDETIGIDAIYKYQGYLVDDSETETDYVIKLRSYTGAVGFFYVNKTTGDVSMAWNNPVTEKMEPTEYLYNMYE